MNKTTRNILRHFFIIALSFVILIPIAKGLNRNYYLTIERVNYYEEREIISLIKFILQNVDAKKIENSLKISLEDIRFLAITIKKNDHVIVNKEVEGMAINKNYESLYKTGNYEVIIRRREYSRFWEDYKKYLKALLPWNTVYRKSVLVKPDASLNEYIKHLSGNQESILNRLNLIIFITQLAIIFFLETMVLLISVKHRFKMVKEEVDNLKNKMMESENV